MRKRERRRILKRAGIGHRRPSELGASGTVWFFSPASAPYTSEGLRGLAKARC